MPQVFKVGSFLVYFWSNENEPLEPVHVHVAEGRPKPNGTKIWITESGKCLLPNNNSQLPEKALNVLIPVLILVILFLSTAYLVDSTYNPFLYFRF